MAFLAGLAGGGGGSAGGRPLALPSALIFIGGITMIYFGLRGLDQKHGLFNHVLAGPPTTGGTGNLTPGPDNSVTGGGTIA